MMQLGVDGVFVGSGIFKSGNPKKRADAMVQAVTHYKDPQMLAEISEDLGEPMVRELSYFYFVFLTSLFKKAIYIDVSKPKTNIGLSGRTLDNIVPDIGLELFPVSLRLDTD